MSDFVVDDAGFHYARSKNADYQQSVTTLFTVLINFLQDNGLTKRMLLIQGEKPTKNLKIMQSDLTKEGFEVLKSSYDKWLSGIDNGKPISDISILEKALLKARK